MRIATWNINSVRLRIGLVTRFVEECEPDVLCLQETKCPPGQFPTGPLARLGYNHIAENGYTGHHGVAIVSRLPIAEQQAWSFCGRNDGRHISIRPEGSRLCIHSLYVPAGGDEPDPSINEKFAHKLRFVDELSDWSRNLTSGGDGQHHVLTGDFNIAPLECDVWSHKQLLKVVSHTPVETSKLTDLMNGSGFHDPVRHFLPEPQKVYSWWSYRSRDWSTADKGRRLDHIWVPQSIAENCRSVEIVRQARGWDRPSDHVPVILDINEP